MALKGSVIGQDTDGNDTINTIDFTVSLVAGGDPVNLTPPGSVSGTQAVVIDYRDGTQLLPNVTWTMTRIIDDGDGDNLLEEDEQYQISVDVSAASLGTNTEFTLEIKPPTGAVFSINRTTPAAIDAVTDL